MKLQKKHFCYVLHCRDNVSKSSVVLLYVFKDSSFARLIDWMIEYWLTLSEQYFIYIQDENKFHTIFNPDSKGGMW